MAWSTPASWSVGEVVTASKLNTHLKANLEYLKGAAGTVTLDADLAVTRSAAGSTVGAYVDNTGGSSSGTVSRFALGMTTAETNALLLQYDHNADEATIFQRGGGDLILQAASGDIVLTAAKVGIGTASPQGKLHIYGAIAGWLKYEFDGLDGTARTVIPDGTGDVLYGMQLWSLVRHSGGTVQVLNAGGTVLQPSLAYDIYNSGGNIAQIQLAANGAVTVQRTAGTGTYKVSLMMQWL